VDLWGLGGIVFGALSVLLGLSLLVHWAQTPNIMLVQSLDGYWLPRPVTALVVLCFGVATGFNGYFRLRR
jgi:hypothetical protein